MDATFDDDAIDDGNADTATQQVIVSAVWRSNVLGLAFMEGTTLRFGSVPDAAPDFRMLQACKYQVKPTVVIAPSSSDPAWYAALGTPCLLAGATVAAGPGADEDEVMMTAAGHGGADEDDEPCSASGGPRVVALKNRDFSAETAAKRLALLRTLTDLPAVELSEKEVLIYLEHMVPREQEQARRAIAGLLTYHQRCGEEMGGCLAVTALRRFSLESQLYMAPETFLSLGIFADDQHPSAHGGRSKDGFSIWSLFNRTRSKPGERVLRTWFARPTQDLATLRERHGFIECLAAPQSAQLLPALHAVVGKVKDVTKLEASLSRGGLLLGDFSAVLLTASSAVKAKELLLSAEVPTELPAIARAHAAIEHELYTVANTVASVVDFDASGRASALCPGAAKHIAVRPGVHADLDALRDEYEQIEPLGFLIKLPLPGFAPEQAAEIAEAYAHDDVGLAYQFDADGEFYFKGGHCAALDHRYGDIASQIKDIECQLVRHLEEKLLEWLKPLTAAQHALAELDALLSLAVCARDLSLVRPVLAEDATGELRVSGGWHPLLAASGPAGMHATPTLVPNDCELGTASERLMLLTGPNASGKTVYIRTVALIVYLAHIGSYVPAEEATVARTDAIHTRMHSKESAAVNASAFMLDLGQMAALFKHSTARSLCLIDEFGKGTNAQDGISLLYASLAELLRRGAACPRVLACTHYTELLDIPGFREQPGLSLWTMQVLLKDTRSRGDEPTGHATGGGAPPAGEDPFDDHAAAEWRRTCDDDDDDEALDASPAERGGGGWYGDHMAPLHAVLDDEVVFLYKAVRGACTDSFGSHCAAQADMPRSVIQRARHVSRCRLEGRPIERYDVDSARAAAKEAQLAALVDSFLQYDFHAGTAGDFYESVDALMP